MNNHLISLNNKDEIYLLDSYFKCISEYCIIDRDKECITSLVEINFK